MNNFKNITNIVETYMSEVDEEAVEVSSEDKQVKIFFSDLSPEGQKKVLDTINAEFEYADIFTDDIVRGHVEEQLSKRPLVLMSGEEIVNMMDIEM